MKSFASSSSLRCVTAGFLLVFLSTAAVMMITRTSASHLFKTQADALVFPKGDVDEMKTGRSAEAAIGANETRLPDYTPDVQAYLTRAYPASDISLDQTIGAQNGWASLNAGAHSAGAWQLVGPSKATQPGVLNVLEDGVGGVGSRLSHGEGAVVRPRKLSGIRRRSRRRHLAYAGWFGGTPAVGVRVRQLCHQRDRFADR